MRTLLFLLISGIATAGTIESGRYYTWQIPEPNIPAGSIITGATLTLHGLTTATEVDGPGSVQVYLADNAPAGWVGNAGDVTQPTGSRPQGRIVRGPTLLWKAVGDANDVSVHFRDIALPGSWTHRIFPTPLRMTTPNGEFVFNAAKLELIDILGNGTPGGLVLRSVGGKATVDRISLQLTIQSFEASPVASVVAYGLDVPIDWQWRREQLIRTFVRELMEMEQ